MRQNGPLFRPANEIPNTTAKEILEAAKRVTENKTVSLDHIPHKALFRSNIYGMFERREFFHTEEAK